MPANSSSSSPLNMEQDTQVRNSNISNNTLTQPQPLVHCPGEGQEIYELSLALAGIMWLCACIFSISVRDVCARHASPWPCQMLAYLTTASTVTQGVLILI